LHAVFFMFEDDLMSWERVQGCHRPLKKFLFLDPVPHRCKPLRYPSIWLENRPWVVRTFPTIPKKADHPNEEGQNLAERIDISLHLVYHVPRPTFKVKVSKSEKRLSIQSGNKYVGTCRKWSKKATKAKRDGFNSSYLCNLNLNFKKRLLFMMYKRR